jgi:hypothetical protein
MNEGCVINSERFKGTENLFKKYWLVNWLTKFIVDLQCLDVEEIVGESELVFRESAIFISQVFNSNHPASLFVFLCFIGWNTKLHLLPSLDDHQECSLMEDEVNKDLH